MFVRVASPTKVSLVSDKTFSPLSSRDKMKMFVFIYHYCNMFDFIYHKYFKYLNIIGINRIVESYKPKIAHNVKIDLENNSVK